MGIAGVGHGGLHSAGPHPPFPPDLLPLSILVDIGFSDKEDPATERLKSLLGIAHPRYGKDPRSHKSGSQASNRGNATTEQVEEPVQSPLSSGAHIAACQPSLEPRRSCFLLSSTPLAR